MQRRSFLRLGVGAAAVLAVAGAGVALWSPGLQDGRLSAPARSLMSAVARAVLEGSLPKDPAQADAALQAHLTRLESTLNGLAPNARKEVSDLLALLSAAPGRLALAGLGADWARAEVAEVQAALQSMRVSSSQTRQQIYHALRDLTNAAYFADPASWAALGYPGPQTV